MFDKKFLTVMAAFALVLGASLFFAGCSTGEDTTVFDKSGSVYGEVSAVKLQAAIDKAIDEGRSLTLEGITVAAPGGAVNLKSASVTIAGTVTLNDVVLAALNGVAFSDANARIAGTGLKIIGDNEVFDGKVPSATVYIPVATDTSTPIQYDTAIVEDFTIGGSGSNDPTWAQFAAYAGTTHTLYTVGKVTIAENNVDTTTTKFVALGDVETANTVTTLKLDTAAYIAGKLTAGANLALSGLAQITGTLDTGAFVVTDANATTVALAALNSDPATATAGLTVGGNVTSVVIGGGNGNAAFTGSTPAFTSPSYFGNTGKTVFSASVGTTANLTFEGPATFTTALTDTKSGGATVTFNGATTSTIAAYTAKVNADKTVFAGSGPLTITTLTAINLGFVVFDGPGLKTISNELVSVVGPLTIEGDGPVALTAPLNPVLGLAIKNRAGVKIPSLKNALPVDTSIDATDGKVIFGSSTGSVTIEDGVLASAAGGLANAAANGAVTVGYTGATGATLVLNDGGSLTIGGTGSVVIGDGLAIKGNGTTLASIGDSTFEAGANKTATLETDGSASDGIQIGTDANGIKLLAVGAAAMTYTFTASVGSPAPVSIEGAYITAPAGTTTGAIFAATTDDGAKILLGTATGGIKLEKGTTAGGTFKIAHDSNGSVIGPFGSGSNSDGYLPISVGITDTAGDAAEKVLLGSYSSSTGLSSPGADVEVHGATGNANEYATINSSVVLADNS